MGNKHLDFPNLGFQFHDITEHVTWIDFRGNSKNPEFHPKQAVHLFLHFTVSHDH